MFTVWVRILSAIYFEAVSCFRLYEGWNFNSGIYLFTTDTK